MKNSSKSKSEKHNHAVVVGYLFRKKSDMDKIGGIAYDPVSIIHDNYPEIWNSARECVCALIEWQNAVVELLPVFQEEMPDSFEKLEDIKAQIVLLNYIKLRSIYSLSERMWKTIDNSCRNLAESHRSMDEDSIEKFKGELDRVFDIIESFPFKNIAEDNASGFFRLDQSIMRYKDNNGAKDFVVFPKDGRYSDISGAMIRTGVRNMYLWEMAVNSQDPEKPSITGLMEAPKDGSL